MHILSMPAGWAERRAAYLADGVAFEDAVVHRVADLVANPFHVTILIVGMIFGKTRAPIG